MLVSHIFLLSAAFLLQEGSCVIWGSKNSPSGVRGTGQRTPQAFDLERSLEELKDISSHFKPTSPHSLHRRQADEMNRTVNRISSIATLTNDSHNHAIVHWTGYPSENIFLLTRKLNNSRSEESWLWRSTDYGQTFVNETYKLPNDSILQGFFISPNKQLIVFSDVVHQMLHVSRDEGNTYTAYMTPFVPNRIVFQSILAPRATQALYNELILGYDSQAETLWVSTDLGATWSHIADNVPAKRYYWRRLNTDVEGDLTTVYFEMRTDSNRNYSMLYFTTAPYYNIQLFSPDLGRFQSGSFVLEHEYMFVQKSDSAAFNNATYSSELWVSYNRARVFQQTTFPLLSEELNHLHFSVIDASEGQVLVAIYHNISITNLYISDTTGTMYSLSLEYIISPSLSQWEVKNPKFDVHVVEGIVGTYFANQKVPGRTFGSTLITRNKGGQWSGISPPVVNRFGSPLSACGPPDCSLHLRMNSDSPQYQSILSQHTAAGLIMAVGNRGSRLTATNSQVYLSRDGGDTWAEVETGRWEFQHIAQGSVIVMVKKFVLVSSVKLSCDEGLTWETIDFVNGYKPPNSIYVIGMKTEFGERPRHVTVFGLDYLQYINRGYFEWLIISINLTSVISRPCDPEDYFSWIATDERPGGRCLLGEVVTYERRNSSACCYVDPEYEKPINRTPCICAIEDFECDFGFSRESVTSPCTPLAWITYPTAPPTDCPEMDNYTYTSGYRKIPGDKCFGGVSDSFSPRTAPCPIYPPSALSISYSPGLIRPDTLVNFRLQQNEGSRMVTVYRWNFNDSSLEADYNGIESAQLQQHAFDRPGVYTVYVRATNQAGSSEAFVTVSVLDILSQFTVDYSNDLSENSVPILLKLVFSARLLTQYGSNHLGQPLEYSWDFGDGNVLTHTPQSVVTHTYRGVGIFTFSCTVHAAFATVSNQVTKSIRTYKAARTVNIVKAGGEFVLVGDSIAFFTELQPESMDEIPPGTNYTWHIQSVAHTSENVISLHGAEIEYTFSLWGEYRVTVIGSYPSGLFIGELTVFAQHGIEQLQIKTKPTFRLSTVISFELNLLSTDSTNYLGPITIVVKTLNDSLLTSHESVLTTASSPIQLFFESKNKGVMDIVLIASNDVSELREELTVIVVGKGEYGAISMTFLTDKLPSNYNKWQQRLSASVIEAISKTNGIKSDRIEVESIEQTQTREKPRQSLQKRSDQLFLTVVINIMPAEYSESAIRHTRKIATEVIALFLNKTIVLVVDGVTLTVDHVKDGNAIPITSPGSNTLQLAVGLTFGGLFIVALVLLGTTIGVCYSKYKNLNSKYSNLVESSGGGDRLAFTEVLESEAVSKNVEGQSDMEFKKLSEEEPTSPWGKIE